MVEYKGEKFNVTPTKNTSAVFTTLHFLLTNEPKKLVLHYTRL